MASRYNIRRAVTGAYCVTEEFLKDIHLLFEKTFQTQPKLTINFKNRHQFVCDNVSDFLSDSSARSEPIESLSISSGWNKDFHAEVDFASGFFSGVFVTVSGDRDRCIVFERDVLNELKSIKTVHSFLHFGPTVEGLTFGMGAAVVSLILFAYNNYDPSFFEYVGSIVFGMLLLSLARSILFPKFEFGFGKGRSSISLRKNFIYVVFGMLIVGGITAIYEDRVVKFANSVIDQKDTE